MSFSSKLSPIHKKCLSDFETSDSGSVGSSR